MATQGPPQLPPILPPLRSEIVIQEGGMDFNGTPTWILQDPLNNAFFHIGWKEFEILSRWRAVAPQTLLDTLKQESLAEVNQDDLLQLIVFLSNHCLIEQTVEAVQRAKEKATPKKTGWMMWLVHHYLFFRVPLLQPDAFLTRTYPSVSWVFSQTFMIVIFVLAAVGLLVLSSSWNEYVTTFFDLFNLESLVLYGVSLCIVKVFHELGHAYACKKHGVRVPTMGVAFLVMMPLLYTDTTESWKVKDAKQRIQIALAGVWVELCIAVIALWLWMIASPGVVKSILFFMSSVSLMTTILINISPFLRFDGYHVLSDLLSMRNLQTRAFALTRWKIREWLFGLGDEPPEQFTRSKQWVLYIYSIAAWLYRFFLFLGIAMLVYHFFFKMLGIILFCIEMVFFILAPLYYEVKEWWGLKDRITSNFQTTRSLVMLGVVIALIVLPWAHTISLPATVAPYEQKYFVKEPAQVSAVYIKQGDSVVAGQVLMVLESPRLEFDILSAKYKVEGVQWALRNTMTQKKRLSKQNVALSQLHSAQAQLQERQDVKKNFTIVAPFDGTIAEFAEGIKPGVWVQSKQVLFVMTNPHRWTVKAYADLPQLSSLKVGQEGHFFSDHLTLPRLETTISRIEEQATAYLMSSSTDRRLSMYVSESVPDAAYHASTLGGKIPARATEHNEHVPEESIYPVIFEPQEESDVLIHTVQRGVVKVEVPRFFWISAWAKKWLVRSYQEANF